MILFHLIYKVKYLKVKYTSQNKTGTLHVMHQIIFNREVHYLSRYYHWQFAVFYSDFYHFLKNIIFILFYDTLIKANSAI